MSARCFFKLFNVKLFALYLNFSLVIFITGFFFVRKPQSV